MGITAFISYSWDNEEHIKWVNRLAHILWQSDIEAIVDQIHVQFGMNLRKFMLDGINSSRWVICVLSDGYIRKIDDLSTGVGKEMGILKDGFNSDFVIPLLKNNSTNIIPDYFKDKFYIDFDKNDEIYEIQKLVRRLHGFNKAVEPLVTRNPFSKDVASELILNTEIAKSTYINPEFKGKIEFDYSNNDGVYTIGSGEYAFPTKWSKAGDKSIHAYNDKLNGGKIAIVQGINSIAEFTSSKGLDFTSRSREVPVSDAVVWINSYGNMAITQIVQIVDCKRNGTKDSLKFDYEIFDMSR